MSTVELPTREQVEGILILRDVNPFNNSDAMAIVSAYAHGRLLTRGEFIDSLDLGAAAEEFRLKSYEPKIPERRWAELAPGARNTWVMHTQCVLDAALGKDTVCLP